MTATDAAERLPHWNLDDIFPGLDSQPFEQAARQLATQLDDLDAFLKDHGIHPDSADMPSVPGVEAVTDAIDGYLQHMSAAMQLNAKLRLYVWCLRDTDSTNELAARRLSELDPYTVRLRQQRTQFEGWLGRHKQLLPDVIASSEPARAHSLYLREAAEQSQYLMGAGEESLAAELAPSGIHAWSKLHGTIWSQLTVPFEREGKIEQLPMTMIQSLASSDPDAGVRQRAAEAEVKAWATMREPLAAALNGVMGTKIILNKRRGRRDTLHAALDQARIDGDILDALQRSIRDALPSLRQYFKAKAVAWGKDRLPWWDRYAPLGQTERRFTFSEAQDFITTQFERFSPQLGAFATRAFERHWIDAEPRAGKQGGAYCNEVPGTGVARILCNFDGSLSEVFGIAHELGHAFHTHCQAGKTPSQCQTPMTLAETASLFCETLVTDQALAHASSPQEELAILNTFLITATINVVQTLCMYGFEREVYERRASSELSADEICSISTKYDREFFGDVLDPDCLHPYNWAAIPHSFIADVSFYNYPYAFGLLFSLGLYAHYQQRGAAFVADFESLLANTGELMPQELAARFGMDLCEPGFWQASLGLINRRIERFQELCIASNLNSKSVESP